MTNFKPISEHILDVLHQLAIQNIVVKHGELTLNHSAFDNLVTEVKSKAIYRDPISDGAIRLTFNTPYRLLEIHRNAERCETCGHTT